jgi:hypothetical protein
MLIIVTAGLAYLPLAARLSYAYDDWYLMWAAKAYGPQAFFPIFSIDRPLRAYLMLPAYMLFGENPLWYNLSAYVFRVLGGLAFGWMLGMLWPRARTATLGMALLFVIYPGFLSQPNAIDYQSHIIALTLALTSLALMVKAFQLAGPRWQRVVMLIVSAVLGWMYLGLMEYYIGFELIRLLLIFLLAMRAETNWLGRLKKTVLGWLPLALVPLGFIYWRVYIFVGERKATDASAQLSLFTASPLRAVFNWSISLVKDMLDVLLMAWITPLAQLLENLSRAQILAGFGLGLLAILATWYVFGKLDDDSSDLGHWRIEAFWLGLASIVAGLIPVVLANREVYFPYYSRYTLISCTGAVMLMVALIFLLPKWRQLIFSFLVLVAVLTHFGNSVKAANETASMNNFWWQVAWRVPQLEQNTTLVANYPLVSIQEDYFVWGPANLIYYPEKLNEDDLQPGVYAAIPDEGTAQKVLARERQQYDKRRNIITYANYRNVLILIQNRTSECVRVIDGMLPESSHWDTDGSKQMAPYSELEHILVNSPQHLPPSVVFGPEPAHTWCYYYEKASLARQKGDWDEVRRLGTDAFSYGFYAENLIEWVPFIQAYAFIGDFEKIGEISSRFRSSLDNVECKSLAHPQISGVTQQKLETIFCQSTP